VIKQQPIHTADDDLTRNSMSVHIAIPCVIIGSWSSPLPSQQSSSTHLPQSTNTYNIAVPWHRTVSETKTPHRNEDGICI